MTLSTKPSDILLELSIPFEYDGAYHVFGEGKWGCDNRPSTLSAKSFSEPTLALSLSEMGYTNSISYLIERDYHFRTDGSKIVVLGGLGSGHHGHKGRPGQRGGSTPGKNLIGFIGIGKAELDPFSGPRVNWDAFERLVADTGIDDQKVYNVLSAWAVTPTDSYLGIAVQESIAKEFGVEMSEYLKTAKTKLEQEAVERKDMGMPILAKRIVSTEDTSEQERRAIVRVMYTNTQQLAVESGYKPDDTITLYRGIGRNTAPYTSSDYRWNPAEAWTADKSVAERFASSRANFLDEPFKYGAVVQTTVPIKQVLSTGKTGFGFSELSEIVIIGGGEVSIESTETSLSEDLTLLGGPGSGHHGHAGRPGKRGGSAPSGGGLRSAPVEFGFMGYRTGKDPVSMGDPELEDIRQQVISLDVEARRNTAALFAEAEDTENHAHALQYEAERLRRRAAAASLGMNEGDPETYEKLAKDADEEGDILLVRASELRTEAHALEQQSVRDLSAIIQVAKTPANVTLEQARLSRLSQGTYITAEEGAKEFSKMVEDRDEFTFFGTGRILVRKTDEGEHRASFDQDTIRLNEYSGTSTVIHEMGHWLEANDRGASAVAAGFLKTRTYGEAAVGLRNYSQGYNAGEMTKPDKFFNVYVGKQYYPGVTEVISMGLEHMYTNPGRLAQQDPQHFSLIYNIMRNNYDNDFMGNLIEASEEY